MCVKRLCTSKPTSSDEQAVQTAAVIVDCVLCLLCHVPLLRDGATGFNFVPLLRDHATDFNYVPLLRDGATGFNDVPVFRDGATGFNRVPLLRDHATGLNYVPLLGDHATDVNYVPLLGDHATDFNGQLSCGSPRLVALGIFGALAKLKSAANDLPYTSQVALGLCGQCSAQASKVAHYVP